MLLTRVSLTLDRAEGGVVELGAAVLMGVQGGNPLAVLCRQHGVAMHRLSNACPLHDGSGGKLLPPETDAQVEKLFNLLLDEAGKERETEASEAALLDPHVGLEVQVLWQGKWYRAKVVDRVKANGRGKAEARGRATRHAHPLGAHVHHLFANFELRRILQNRALRFR